MRCLGRCCCQENDINEWMAVAFFSFFIPYGKQNLIACGKALAWDSIELWLSLSQPIRVN